MVRRKPWGRLLASTCLRRDRVLAHDGPFVWQGKIERGTGPLIEQLWLWFDQIDVAHFECSSRWSARSQNGRSLVSNPGAAVMPDPEQKRDPGRRAWIRGHFSDA